MGALWILLISVAILFIAYLTYGSWLAKEWGVDESKVTPAHTMEDGIDYVPAKAQVLMGHHFASIAGAGPINGPILAAMGSRFVMDSHRWNFLWRRSRLLCNICISQT